MGGTLDVDTCEQIRSKPRWGPTPTSLTCRVLVVTRSLSQLPGTKENARPPLFHAASIASGITKPNSSAATARDFSTSVGVWFSNSPLVRAHRT